MPSLLPLATGLVAISVTVGFIVFQIILASSAPNADAVRTTAIISIAAQGLVVLGLGALCVTHIVETLEALVKRHMNLTIGVGFTLSTLAAIASVATLVLLSKTTSDLGPDVLGMSKTTMLITSAILVGTAYPLQLLFYVFQFVIGRKPTSDAGPSIFQRGKSPTSGSKLKAIPYNQTNVSLDQRQANNSIDAPSFAASVVGRKSGIESSGSVSSRTRLLPLREKRRPASLESMANRSSTEDTFESWDTSSVDAHNRQTVLDVSSSPPTAQKPRFLETIPASPTGSRSPSPGSSIDLAPPRRARRRSRSYSPASSRRASITSIPNTSEAHIHPLFRSDSAEPPPVATPGTSVVASPIAGQVISPRPSMRSLNRMRSGSLPAAPSPLSRQSSFEDAVAKRLQDEQSSIKEEKEDEEEEGDDDSVRKMTPPIPDWIMSAGNRSSLNGYKRRTMKDRESKPSATEASR